MTAAKPSRTLPCQRDGATARLDDATAFLDTAQAADNTDVIATNAIHAAIASSDVLCCLTLGERSASTDHQDAVVLLRRVDPKLAISLKRCLAIKTKAAYEVGSVSSSGARQVVKQATALHAAARASMDATS
jgi:hypothetical protein